MILAVLALGLAGGGAQAGEAPPGGAPDLPEFPLLAWDMLGPVQLGSDHFDLSWNVLGAGGGTSTSAHFSLSSTIGQAAVGEKSSPHFESCTGFWCGLRDFIYEIFLPLIMKG
jgi:hypothetical protein